MCPSATCGSATWCWCTPAHRVEIVAFDKTGTLTEGKPELVALEAHAISRDAALAWAAAIQAGSEHPLARAVTQLALKEQLDVPAASQVRAVAGQLAQLADCCAGDSRPDCPILCGLAA